MTGTTTFALDGATLRTRLERLKDHISPLTLRRALSICERVDGDGRVTLDIVHAAFEPSSGADALNTATSSLRRDINKAAREAGVDLTVNVGGEKRAGPSGRYFAFVAGAPSDPHRELTELANASDRLVQTQRATPMAGQPPRVAVEYASDKTSRTLARKLNDSWFGPAIAAGLQPFDATVRLAGEIRENPSPRELTVVYLDSAYTVEHEDGPTDRPALVVTLQDLPRAGHPAWLDDAHCLELPMPESFQSRHAGDQRTRFANALVVEVANVLKAQTTNAGTSDSEQSEEFDGRAFLNDHELDIGRVSARVNSHARPFSMSRVARDGVEPGNSEIRAVQTTPVQETLLQWAQASDPRRLCALVGDSGLGKTINAQLFYESMSQIDSSRRALYFDLRAVGGFDFRAFATQQALNPELRLADALLTRCITEWGTGAETRLVDLKRLASQRPTLWIVDGLDEALVHMNAAQGQALGRELLAIPRLGDDVKMLLTCRDQYFESLEIQRTYFREGDRDRTQADDYLGLKLLPFTREQVADYVRRSVSEPAVTRMLETLRSVHDLEGLASRPYNLKVIVELYPHIEERVRAGATVNTVWIYEQIVSGWLGRDDGKHQFTPDDKRRLMEALAAWTWSQNRRGIEPSDLRDWLTKVVADDAVFARRYRDAGEAQLQEDLRTATFLARSDDRHGRSTFRFAHTSIHEFFLSRALLSGLRRDEKTTWALPMPSGETLDFIVQYIEAATDRESLRNRVAEWGSIHDPMASPILLALAVRFGREPGNALDLPRFDFGAGNWRNLRLCGTPEHPFNLRAANGAMADLRGADFEYVDLSGANLSHAQLDWSRLDAVLAERSTMNEVRTSGATIRNCDWSSTTLTGVDFQSAHIINTRLPSDSRAAERALPGVEVPLPGLEALTGHAGGVRAVAFSPDGSRLVTGGRDFAVRVWNTTTWETLHTLTDHTDWVLSVAISPDGTCLATGGGDGRLRVWDTATWKTLHSLTGHTDWVRSVAFSPDGTRLATGGDDGEVRVWDTTTWKILHTLTDHTDWVSAVAFSPDGTRLASSGDDGQVRVWETATGVILHTLTGHADWVLSVQFSPDGTRLATGSDDGKVRVWDTATWRILHTLTGHTGGVQSVAFSPDGTHLATGGGDSKVRVWETATWKILRTLTGHADWVRSVAFSPDGTRLATGGDDGKVRLWETTTWDILHTLTGATDWVRSVAFSPDGTRLATGGDDGEVRVWDTTTWEILHTLTDQTGWVLSVAFSPDGTRLATSGGDFKVRVWDTATWNILQTLTGHTDWVRSVAFSPDGTRLATGGDDGKARVWDTATWETLNTLTCDTDWVRSVAFSPDGTRLATSGDDGEVLVWDTATGEILHTLTGHSDWVLSVAFSPDGTRLASGGDDGEVVVWDTATGTILDTLTGHTGWVSSVAFSPDGTRLATSGDHEVRVWDTATARLLRTLTGYTGGLHSMAYSPDGTRLATGGALVIVFAVRHNGTQQATALFASPRGAAAWLMGTPTVLWTRGDTTQFLWLRLEDLLTRRTIAFGPAEEFLSLSA